MARMPRGEPRSVPDPDREGYDAMTRGQKLRNEQQELSRAGLRREPRVDEAVIAAVKDSYRRFRAKDANGKPIYLVGHPGFAESLVPVVGAGHEALADFQEGHPVAGAVNLGLAGWEASGVGTVASDVTKVGLRLGKSQTWGALRKVYGKAGLIEKFQPGHHMIPRSAFPDWVPDRVVHNWLNIKPMADDVVEGIEHTGSQIHRRTHGRANVGGEILPKFNVVQQLRYATKPSTRALLLGGPEAVVRTAADKFLEERQ